VHDSICDVALPWIRVGQDIVPSQDPLGPHYLAATHTFSSGCIKVRMYQYGRLVRQSESCTPDVPAEVSGVARTPDQQSLKPQPSLRQTVGFLPPLSRIGSPWADVALIPGCVARGVARTAGVTRETTLDLQTVAWLTRVNLR
jgi:hypothetical protein